MRFFVTGIHSLVALTLFLVAGFSSAGCDGLDLLDPDPVLLRVQNASTEDFASVAVGFTGDEANYGPVGAGQTSDYAEFETAYRYGGVTVRVGTETYQIIPFDFVGEDPLEAGTYTFVLRIVGSSLRLEFMEDEA
ncbi:MAG: hypothetical protein AAGI52_09290 [Bacteroidota bacterium]